MSKKIISIFLVVSIVFSILGVYASAVETEKYGSITVCFIESNERQTISVMSINENIYVDVNFYKQFGFEIKTTDKVAIIGNTQNKNLPKGAFGFFYDSTEVCRVNGALSEFYAAPFKTVKNDKGIWIPFEYSLCIFNGSILLKNDSEILLSAPKLGLFDLLHNISAYNQSFSFDYAKDFSYGNGTENFLNASTHFVNVFNGLLTFDGASWISFINTNSILTKVLGDIGYDSKYGETVARMVCTNSSDELSDAVDIASTIKDFLHPDGAVSEIFTDLRNTNEAELGELLEQSQQALKNIDKTNDGVSEYNRIYNQLEKSMVKSDFLELGDDIKNFQKGTQNVATGLELFCMVAESVYYLSEFASSDPYAVDSLELFANNLPGLKGGVSFNTKQAILRTAEEFKDEAADYAVSRFIKENAGEIASKGLDICASANVALLAWDLISSLIPFVSDGLNASDKHELSIYAMCLQNEAHRIYNEKLTRVLSSCDNVTEEDLIELSQYAYAYLKLCYITRNAAIAGMHTLTQEGAQATDTIAEAQKAINTDIAVLLNIAKSSVNKESFACLGNYENVLSTKNISYNQEYETSSEAASEDLSEADVHISEAEAIAAFECMLKDSDAVWGWNIYESYDNHQFASMSNSEIIENWIVCLGSPLGVYEAFSPDGINGIKYTDQPREENAYSDPDGKFWCSYELDADLVDWILKNVFGKEPDRSISSDKMYYSGDKIYVDAELGGGLGYVYKVSNYEKLSGGKYCIYVDAEYEVDMGVPVTHLKFTATPKQDVEKGVYWQIHSCEGQNNEISETTTTSEARDSDEALFESCIKSNITINNSKSPQADGAFNVLVKDFDGDNLKEMVVFSLRNDENSGAYLSLDLYTIKNGIVKLVDSSDEFFYARIGAYDTLICATTEDNTISLNMTSSCSGGSQYTRNVLSYEIGSGKLKLLNHYYLYHYPRYNRFDCIEKVSGTTYPTIADFGVALEWAGYTDKHLHRDTENGNGLITSGIKGNHVFTIIDDSYIITYSAIYNNINFISG